jgi:hypothetical protein
MPSSHAGAVSKPPSVPAGGAAAAVGSKRGIALLGAGGGASSLSGREGGLLEATVVKKRGRVAVE